MWLCGGVLLPCRRGGIMLTTYGMVLHNASQIMSGKGTAVARGEAGPFPLTSNYSAWLELPL